MQIETIYTECHHCRRWYSHLPIISHRDYEDKECWSDSDCVHLSLSFPLMLFSKCNKCQEIFWFDDCRQIRDYEIGVQGIISANSEDECKKHIQNSNNQLHKDFLKANPDFCRGKELPILGHAAEFFENTHENIIDNYMSLLQSTELKTNQEIYLRTLIWQLINDFDRKDKKPMFEIFKKRANLFGDYNKLRRENLQILSGLLQKENYENVEITLIEIERELGNFEKAKTLIKNLDKIDKHHFKSFITISSKLIIKKSTKVFRLK